MMTRPITLVSHCARDVGAPNGSAAITVSISSVERSSVSAPPIAISEVEAKKAVPFCSAAMTWRVDHAHVARQHALHPDIAISVHQRVEAAAAVRRALDQQRIAEPGADEARRAR